MPGPIYPVLIISCCRERRPTSESRRYKHQQRAILTENSNRGQYQKKNRSLEIILRDQQTNLQIKKTHSTKHWVVILIKITNINTRKMLSTKMRKMVRTAVRLGSPLKGNRDSEEMGDWVHSPPSTYNSTSIIITIIIITWIMTTFIIIITSIIVTITIIIIL